MKEISAAMVKDLRNKTGAGIMDCKNALKKCDGDIEKSFDFLRKKGILTASKRSSKTASEGRIESYIHMGGKIGVIIEINCETDFVAKMKEFSEFSRNIAMHIAASNPIAITSNNISKEVIEREKEIYYSQLIESNKPKNIIDKIIDGKLTKFFKENCLINQKYVKDPDKTIMDYLNEMIGKTGEKIEIKRFVRFQIGEA